MKIVIYVHKTRTGSYFVSKKDLRRLQKILTFSENVKQPVDVEYIPDKFIPKKTDT